MKRVVKIIHKWRLLFFLVIIVSFLSVLGANPVTMGVFIGKSAGAVVGMQVSVPENPFNKLAMQLSDWESDLAKREADINAREKQIAEADSFRHNKTNQFILLLIVVLAFLICLNFFLDWRRRKEEKKFQ